MAAKKKDHPPRNTYCVKRSPKGWDVFAVECKASGDNRWETHVGEFATEQEADAFALQMIRLDKQEAESEFPYMEELGDVG